MVVLSEHVGDGVLVLTLNRPDHHNAWTLEMELLYNESFDRAEKDPDVRAVVLTGAGRSFCPGMDMAVLEASSSGADPYPADRLPPRVRPLMFPKPVIAAVNGACAGIGFNQALMCDLRFAAPGAKFSAAFSRRGLIAEDGVSWLLPRVVGFGRASDLLLSSRPATAVEALEMGLVNRLVDSEDLLAAAVDHAGEIARLCSPHAMSVIKRQLLEDQARTFGEAAANARSLLAEARRSPDYREGVRSFVERRTPRFPGLS
ncbi:enoyl-CoA hydratase-related protein [Actinocorallia populi]|uniref:enoyl-CoA hydratase-related protein n=1 Tax=Actinocorallia populi TaxID=2079200 RepID=UPI000D08A473|nr:enoyl-CoA hydratase-related protein [Actinocorallia populi]